MSMFLPPTTLPVTKDVHLFICSNRFFFATQLHGFRIRLKARSIQGVTITLPNE